MGGSKLFLGGLASHTTTESIRDYFSQYATVSDAIAMKLANGTPRGFGFVTLEEPEVAAEFCANRQVELDGKAVEVKSADGSKPAPRPFMGQQGGGQWQQQGQMNQMGQQQWGGAQNNGWSAQGAGQGSDGGSGQGIRKDANGVEVGKLFLGGVPSGTTTETIVEYFSQFGEVVDAVAMRRPDGTPRGFGFVTFADQSVADAVAQEQHSLDGQAVEVKRVQPKGTGPVKTQSWRNQTGPNGQPQPDKIFVGGLGDMSQETMTAYFQQFGVITDIVAMVNKVTGQSRGFGFVQYESSESVDNLFNHGTQHEIDGRTVEVKRSLPRQANMFQQGGAFQGGFQGNFQGGFQGKGGAPQQQFQQQAQQQFQPQQQKLEASAGDFAQGYAFAMQQLMSNPQYAQMMQANPAMARRPGPY